MPWNSWPLFARFNLPRAGSLRNRTIGKRSPPAAYTARETRSEFSSSLLAYLCVSSAFTTLCNNVADLFLGAATPFRLAYNRLAYDAPRIISIWHSVDNSWSLFIYKSFVDFLSNRTGKKKGKSEDFSSFIFLLKNYSKRRWIRIESTYLRTTVRGHPVLDLWFI